MSKKILAGVVGFSLFTLLAFAGRNEAPFFNIKPLFSDTADETDSAKEAQVTADPKQAFKDLFISSSNGMNLQQLNPLAVSFVEDYMEKHGKNMESLKTWGRPYFDKIDAILAQHNLPKELKYLAVIESNLKNNARSWAGAVGPWQFMPETARLMGLKIGKYDERKDLAKSTHAASKYLNKLFDIYGDWLLVIAAYNGGPAKVNSAIKRSKSRDFWTLQRYLPAESKNHVKKFIATHYIMEGQGSVATLTRTETGRLMAAAELSAEEAANSKLHSISGRYNSAIIARHLTMDIAAFNRLNPNFDKMVASNGSYELRLPNDKMDVFMTKKPAILQESMDLLLGQVAN